MLKLNFEHKKREPRGSLDVKKYYLMLFCLMDKSNNPLLSNSIPKSNQKKKGVKHRAFDLFTVQHAGGTVHNSGIVYVF
jgi:hypothetical protein